MLITCPHCNKQSEHVAEVRKGDLVLDVEGGWAKRDRIAIRLAPLELRTLAALIRAENGLTRKELEVAVWLATPATSENCLPNTVMRLRDKLVRVRAHIPKITPNTEPRYRLIVNP